MRLDGLVWADGSAIAVIASVVGAGAIAGYRWLRASILRGAEPQLDKLRDQLLKELHRLESKLDRQVSGTWRKFEKVDQTVNELRGLIRDAANHVGGELQDIEHRFREVEQRIRDHRTHE